MIPFRSCLHTKKKRRKWKKEETVSFGENPLGSIRLLPGPIQFMVLGAINPTTLLHKRDRERDRDRERERERERTQNFITQGLRY